MGPEAKKKRNQKKKQKLKLKKAEAKAEHSGSPEEALQQENSSTEVISSDVNNDGGDQNLASEALQPNSAVSTVIGQVAPNSAVSNASEGALTTADTQQPTEDESCVVNKLVDQTQETTPVVTDYKLEATSDTQIQSENAGVSKVHDDIVLDDVTANTVLDSPEVSERTDSPQPVHDEAVDEEQKQDTGLVETAPADDENVLPPNTISSEQMITTIQMKAHEDQAPDRQDDACLPQEDLKSNSDKASIPHSEKQTAPGSQNRAQESKTHSIDSQEREFNFPTGAEVSSFTQNLPVQDTAVTQFEGTSRPGSDAILHSVENNMLQNTDDFANAQQSFLDQDGYGTSEKEEGENNEVHNPIPGPTDVNVHTETISKEPEEVHDPIHEPTDVNVHTETTSKEPEPSISEKNTEIEGEGSKSYLQLNATEEKVLTEEGLAEVSPHSISSPSASDKPPSPMNAVASNQDLPSVPSQSIHPPVELSAQPANENPVEDLFHPGSDEEKLPWEQQCPTNDAHLNNTDFSERHLSHAVDSPVLNKPPNHTESAVDEQPHSDLFEEGAEAVNELLPWEVGQPAPESSLADIPEADDASDAPGEGQELRPTTNVDADLFPAEDNESEALPWESEKTEGDQASDQHTVATNEPAKKFSFLEQDDELLDDDDSFLDSDEDLGDLPTVETKPNTSINSQEVAEVTSSGSHLPEKTTSKKYTPSQPMSVDTAPQMVQPVARIITRAEDRAQNSSTLGYATHTPSLSGNTFNTTTTAPLQGFQANVRPVDNMHAKLDQEKKKSDAYDLPLELVPRKAKKASHAKPFGTPNPIISADPRSATLTPVQAGAVPPRSLSNISSGILPPTDGKTSAPPARYAPASATDVPASLIDASFSKAPPNPYAPPAIPMAPKQHTTHSATGNLKSQITAAEAPTRKYAPSFTSTEPPKSSNTAFQYPSQGIRSRAFSNVSSGSLGSAGSSSRQASANYGPRYYGQEPPVGTVAASLGTTPYENVPPIVPALKTVGLSKITQPVLSPNTQRRAHARSNSSVYAPAYSSKYAPTVQPQFHLSPHENMAGDHVHNTHYGQALPPSASKQVVSKPSVAAGVVSEQAVDPQIAFHRQFPIFHWGKSSKVVFALPPVIDSTNYFNSPNLGQDISVVGYDTILKPPDWMKSFPGPLSKPKTKTKDVEKWITEYCLHMEKQYPLKDLSLLHILKLKISSDSTFKDISQVLYDSNELLPFLSQPATLKNAHFNSHKLDHNSQLKVLAALQTGNHLHALDFALSQGDFALALILGSLLGKEKWSEVVDIYLHEEFQSPNDGNSSFSVNMLALIFQVSVGNSKRVIKGLISDPSKENWAMQNWKIITSAVLNNMNQTGDKAELPRTIPVLYLEFLLEFGVFLCQRGMEMEGYTIFVIADIPLSTHEVLPGSGIMFPSIGSMNSIESSLLSELYEFCFSIKEPKFSGFDHFLLQKVTYAEALTDYGLTSAASRYTDHLGASLRYIPKASTLANTVGSRLNFISSKLMGTNGSWLGKPKLSQVWGQLDKSFNKFIGGDNEETNNKESEKIFESFTPGSSRNNSKIDLSQQPSSFQPAASLAKGMMPGVKSVESVMTPPGEQDRPQLRSAANSFIAPPVSSATAKLQPWNSQLSQEPKHEIHQNQWSSTPMHASTSSLNSPAQTIYKNSPRKHQKPATAMTPPPFFSSSRASNSAQMLPSRVEESGLEDASKPMTMRPTRNVKAKNLNRAERVNADLLADLYAPPAIGNGAYKSGSRRSSIQSRGSVQSNYSAVSSPKQLPRPTIDSEHRLKSEFKIENLQQNVNTTYYKADIAADQAPVTSFDKGRPDSTDREASSLTQSLDVQEDHQKKSHQEENSPNTVGATSFADGEEEEHPSHKGYAPDDLLARPPTGDTLSDENVTMTLMNSQHSLPEPAEDVLDLGLDNRSHDELSTAPSVVAAANPPPENKGNPYAPYQGGRKAKSHNNPYAPKSTESIATSAQNTLPATSDDQLNMFAYGGYHVQDPDEPNTQGESPEVQDDQEDDSTTAMMGPEVRAESEEVRAESEEARASSPKEPLESLEIKGRDTSISPPRFQPFNRKLGDDFSDESSDRFSPHAVPVIRPASNPSFKAFTPAPLAVEEQYDDIVENESDDEEEIEKPAKDEGRESESPQPKKTEKKSQDAGDKKQNGGSWFGWLRKETNEKKPVKAKLGHKNAFYYDDKLKRWVNKNATEEEKQQVSTPPPPPPIIKKKLEGSPKVKPRSGSVAGGPAARTAGFLAPINPLTGDPIVVASEEKEPVKNSSPSVSPPVSLSGKKANGLDDIMSLVGTPGSQPSSRRKKKGGRGYVNVMTNM